MAEWKDELMKRMEQFPYKRGDCVIDDNGEIGYVLQSHTSATWNPDGKLAQWTTTINYRWDQHSYGKTRRVTADEISLYTEAASAAKVGE